MGTYFEILVKTVIYRRLGCFFYSLLFLLFYVFMCMYISLFLLCFCAACCTINDDDDDKLKYGRFSSFLLIARYVPNIAKEEYMTSV